jgi:hypothetical protein
MRGQAEAVKNFIHNGAHSENRLIEKVRVRSRPLLSPSCRRTVSSAYIAAYPGTSIRAGAARKQCG